MPTKYNKKTYTYWRIMYRYSDQATEEIDGFDTYTEAKDMLSEYRKAYPAGSRLWLKAVRLYHQPAPGMHLFKVTVQHDTGKIRLRVVATDEAAARKMVCNTEGCPDRAIIKIQNLSEK